MCRDTIFSAEIYRSGLKFTLHNPEAFFNLPSFLINTYNRCHVIFQVCAYGIETVITFFLCDNIFIYRRNHLVCKFTVRSTVILTDKTLGIVRSFFIQRRRGFDELFSTFKLTVSYLSHIVPILEGEGNCQTTELNNGNVSTYIDCYRLEIRESRLTNNQKIL